MARSPAETVVAQISTKLHEIFDGLVCLKDVSDKNTDHQEPFFLTRAYAALAVLAKNNITPEEAANSVTDGGDDDGIDAVHIDNKSKTIYFVQSKFRKNPSKGIELTELTKFRDGVNSIINLDWSEFNKNIHKFKADIEKSLQDIDTRAVMVFAHTSAEPLSKHANRVISQFINEQNKYNKGFIEFLEFNLSDGASAARYKSRPENIDENVLISNWGKINDPYEAIYGTIAADDLVTMYEKHGNKLFAENLRYTIEKSDVNDSILNTAKEEPSHFWYFNNGVTAICERIQKSRQGGSQTNSGSFSVEKISFINGAQTIGTLAKAKKLGNSLDEAKVSIRIISLDGTQEDFASNVTNANNTQNDLSAVDFVAGDPNQERIRKEAAQSGLTYSFRRGDAEPTRESGFDIREATIAAACSSGELRLAVAAKRYISGLWENTKKEPYTKLFNSSTKADDLWKNVQILRKVDETLISEAAKMSGRNKLIAVHGNRFVLFYIFEQLASKNITEKSIITETVKILKRITDIVNEQFLDAYPGNIFKNQDKQAEIFKALSSPSEGGA